MTNRRMLEKLENEEAIDLKDNKREGRFYILEKFVDGADYCDTSADRWIWSIGKRKSDGVILASLAGDLYENDAYECLWLR